MTVAQMIELTWDNQKVGCTIPGTIVLLPLCPWARHFNLFPYVRFWCEGDWWWPVKPNVLWVYPRAAVAIKCINNGLLLVSQIYVKLVKYIINLTIIIIRQDKLLSSALGENAPWHSWWWTDSAINTWHIGVNLISELWWNDWRSHCYTNST